jgi:hypothetical protein
MRLKNRIIAQRSDINRLDQREMREKKKQSTGAN